MTPTKKQKLDWIEKARTKVAELSAYAAMPAFTCSSFYLAGGLDAEMWYIQATTIAMDDPSIRSLSPYDFGGHPYLQEISCTERNNARQMWLAMLQTLVEAGEF